MKKHRFLKVGSRHMNSKSTQGMLVCVPPPPKGAITDSGKAPDAEPAPKMPSSGDMF